MAFFDFLKRILPWNQKPKTPAGGRGPASPAAPAAPTVAPSPGGKLTNEDWLLSGAWLHLASSNAEATRYLWDSELLEVEFKSKKLASGKITPSSFYQYFGVPPAVADGLTTTASPGRYVWSALRDKYEYVRLGITGKTNTAPTVVRVVNNVPAGKHVPAGLKVPRALRPPGWMKGAGS